MGQCHLDIGLSRMPDAQKMLEKQLEGMEKRCMSLRKGKFSKLMSSDYTLCSKKESSPSIMFPDVVCGQHFEYKPWQNSDMSEILEKLPILQDGAHPWITKLEELLTETQPAVGDIKRLLANLIGVSAMEEILQKVGMPGFIATAVNDAELFSAHRSQFWGALNDAFPTNIYPDNILIEPLSERKKTTWRNVTGSDPDIN